MADDIKIAPSATPTDPAVATDEVASRHYQIVKIAFGADGSATLVGASALPVALDAASLAALETINVGNFPATQPISAAALPLPAGASTETTLAALKTVADSLAVTAAAIQAAAEALNAKATTINTGAIAGTVALDATALAALAAAATPGTQPISGNVGVAGVVEIANDTGNAVPVSAASLPLPAGAATQATLAEVSGKLPALDTGRIPVILPTGGGGLTDTELRASAVPVIQAGATTGACTNVAGSATSVTLLASNAARKGAVIHNDSSATLYVVLHASAASLSNFTEALAPGESLVLDRGDYTGEIRGIWTAADGYARVTEFS